MGKRKNDDGPPEVIRTYKMLLLPDPGQKVALKKLFAAHNAWYNATVQYIRKLSDDSKIVARTKLRDEVFEDVVR